MWPLWIDVTISIVGFIVVSFGTIRFIGGHYTREIRGD